MRTFVNRDPAKAGAADRSGSLQDRKAGSLLIFNTTLNSHHAALKGHHVSEVRAYPVIILPFLESLYICDQILEVVFFEIGKRIGHLNTFDILDVISAFSRGEFS